MAAYWRTLNYKSRRSPRLNVLGIMNRNNHLEAYVSFQSINSDVIIACIDAFFPTVIKPTVIVVDQSSIHTSDAILDKMAIGSMSLLQIRSRSEKIKHCNSTAPL